MAIGPPGPPTKIWGALGFIPPAGAFEAVRWDSLRNGKSFVKFAFTLYEPGPVNELRGKPAGRSFVVWSPLLSRPVVRLYGRPELANVRNETVESFGSLRFTLVIRR